MRDQPQIIERGERERAALEPREGYGVPHTSFTAWEPPADPDDDKPIFAGGSQGEARRAERSEAEAPRAEAEAPREGRSEERNEPVYEEDEDPASFTQIFVNVGRRDGARPGDFHRMLVDDGGLDRRDTGRIRIRDRMTFVSVRKEAVDRAIAALAGQVIGGRNVIAEPAKQRSTI